MPGSPQEARWLQYLYQDHSRDELARWARSLRWFRFCRAYGGHANDGDQLKAALCFDSETDLRGLLQAMGASVREYPAGTPQPVPGHAYTADEYLAFPSLVKQFPALGQPGHVELRGVPVFVWIDHNRVGLSLSSVSDRYAVDEATVSRAQELEPLLQQHANRIIEPPQDDRNCLCPRYYGELWSKD